MTRSSQSQFPFRGSILVGTLALSLAALLAPAAADAAPCPLAGGPCGGTPLASATKAFADGPTVVTAPTASLACGMATACTTWSLPTLHLVATWPSTGVRTTDSTGGCIFYSAGMTNSCKVGRFALPVELLRFGVE